MDKSWIDDNNSFSKRYKKGVESFLKFVKEYMRCLDDTIFYPYYNCNNEIYKIFSQVKCDLYLQEFFLTYRDWTLHGQRISIHNSDNDIDDEMINNTKFSEDLVDNLYELLREMRKVQ